MIPCRIISVYQAAEDHVPTRTKKKQKSDTTRRCQRNRNRDSHVVEAEIVEV